MKGKANSPLYSNRSDGDIVTDGYLYTADLEQKGRDTQKDVGRLSLSIFFVGSSGRSDNVKAH